MMRKTIVIGALAAAALGVGGVAAAESASAATPAPASTTAAANTTTGDKAHSHRDLRRMLERSVHAQWTTYDGKTKAYVDHDEIRGIVTAESATSVTIKAGDGTIETYAVTKDTKIHDKAAGKGKAGTMSEVKTGDRAVVVGTGKSSLTATQILDRGLPKPKSTTG
jgi:uncharacterized cupin superfamily protein